MGEGGPTVLFLRHCLNCQKDHTVSLSLSQWDGLTLPLAPHGMMQPLNYGVGPQDSNFVVWIYYDAFRRLCVVGSFPAILWDLPPFSEFTKLWMKIASTLPQASFCRLWHFTKLFAFKSQTDKELLQRTVKYHDISIMWACRMTHWGRPTAENIPA